MAQDDGETPSPLSLPPPPPGLSSPGPGAEGNAQVAGATSGNVSVAKHDAKTGTAEGESDPGERASAATGEEAPQRKASGPPEPITVPQQGLDENDSRGSPGGAVSPILRGRITRVSPSARSGQQRRGSTRSPRRKGAPSPPSPSASSIAKAKEALMAICESINPFSGTAVSKPVLLQKIGKVVGFLQSEDVLQNVAELELDYSKIFLWIRPQLTAPDTLVRTCCFRLLRHFLLEFSAIDVLVELRIHFFVIRSLETEQRHVLERMEALKLCRRIMELECSLLPRAIVRSLVGISRNAEDPFRNVALETLRQLAMRSCSIAAACGGIRALVEAIIDPTLQDMAKSLTLTLVYLLNDSASRQHMRVSMDLAALLSPFTDAGAADSESKAKWAPCQNALLLLLKTWAGVYTLGSDPNGLRALVNMLVQPVSIDLRIVVLETIFLVFIHLSPYDITFAKDIYAEVVIPSSDAEKTKARRGTSTSPRQSSIQMIEGQEAPMVEYWGVGPYSATAQLLASLGYSSEFFPSGQTDPHVIVNQLLVIVLKAFTGCGLVDALTEILVSENPKISELAAQLLAFTMRISERLNPKSIHLKLFSLSQLVKVATDYDKLTSSDTKKSIGPRRAIRVLNALTSLSGASYEASLSTIRAQYAYDDAVALSSELALASSPLSEFQRDNLGITPRGMICALPYTPHLIASVLLDHSIGNSNETSASILASPGFRSASPGARNLRRSSLSATLPLNYKNKSKNRLSFEGIRNSVSLISKSKRAEKKALEDVAQQELVHDTMASAFLSRVRDGQSDLASQALITAVDGIPNVPNKSRALGNMGHRRDVRTKLLTDSAFGDIDSLSARLYRSQVLLGKDYTAWNWSAVEDIIAGPMHHHGLCLEVLKTKFVKRIMGFFRCTAIGEFLILPWKACNQPFTSVAVSLIHVLLDSSEGIEFLRTDRRGKIHRQIIQALQREIHIDDGSTLNSSYFSVAGHRDSSKLDDTSRAVPKSVSSVHSMNLSSSAADAAASTRVFSLMAVSRSMTRDLLTIMGAYTSHTKGMDMLEEHNLLGILTELACNPSKDYLMYVIISVLDYGAEPRCRDWLQKVLLFSKASQGLSLFILGLFRALLRRGQARTDPSFTQWILEMVFSQIERGGSLASSAVSILNEAAFYPMYLDIIVSLNLEPLRPLLQLHFARPLLFKLLGRRRGFDLLESSGWLAEVSREWQVVQCIKYAARYDTLMTSKLLCRHEPKTAIPKSHEELDILEDGDEEDLIKAIDDAFGLEAAAELTEKHLKENSQRIGFRPLRIPVRTFEASAKSDPGFAAPDLLSLLRLPWTVELWLKTSNEGGVKYVRAQTSLECSHLTGPEYGVADDTRIAKELLGKGPSGEKFGSEAHNFVHTGLCVVATPFNESLEVPNDATLYACLTLAGDPLKRNGIVEPVSMCGGGFDTSNTTRSRRSSSVQGRAQSHFHSRKQDNSHTHTQYVRMQPDEVLDYSLKTQDSFPNMDDDKFWIKCGPDHLSHSLHGSNGNEDKGKISYNVCPGATSTATFSFDKANGRVFFRKVAFHLSLQPDFPNAPYIPSHFFGELASTSQGADYLRQTGLIREALEVLLDNSRPRILQRATLWTLGHIASSDTGLTALLEEGFFIRDGDDRSGTDVIKAISDLSLNSECLQLRGTATTVLGLISKTQLGCSILQECGWSTPRPEMREQVGYVIVPRYFASVFRRLPRITKDGPRVWNGLSYIFKNQALDRALIPGLPEEEVNSVLLVFSKLITKVGTRDLHTTLVQIKAKCPEIFRSPTLLIYVHGFLESFGYEDVIRQYLLKTFHRNIPFETPEAWGLLDQGLDILGK